jgi:putative transposase
LGWLLILGERHVRRVLNEFVDHDNAGRPHRALDLHPPTPVGRAASTGGAIVRRHRVYGLVHEYERRAA